MGKWFVLLVKMVVNGILGKTPKGGRRESQELVFLLEATETRGSYETAEGTGIGE